MNLRIIFRLFLSFFLIYNFFLYPHGFHENTVVIYGKNHSFELLRDVVSEVKNGKKRQVKSYDLQNNEHISKRVQAAGFSKIPFYCAISLNNSSCADILCSPVQHFYRLSDHKWVPAYMLAIDDRLLCENNNFVHVTALKLVQESLTVYTIQVKDTHIFLVSNYGIIVHNIMIPVVATAGFGIPFSTGCGSGTLGTVFGPVGFIGGILLGSAVGIFVNTCFKEKFVEYAIELEAPEIFAYIHQSNDEEKAKSNEDAKVEKLPKNGHFPFVAPKSKEGKIPKNKNGAYASQARWRSRA